MCQKEEMMSYIEIKDVKKTFEDGQQVLKGVSLAIEKGEFITLLGSSGCGKTTLLRSIAGLTGVDSGRIYIDDTDVTNLSPRQRNLAMVFQQHSLFPTMTVHDNIGFGLRFKKMDREEKEKKIQEALTLIELEGFGKKYPLQLSGGEQQRVSLARGIVTDPKVLLLDEPFSAIDAKLRKALQIRIKNIHTSLGITTIFVTHDQEEAMRMSDRIYLMNEGKIEQCGSPMDLYLKPQTAYAAGFIGHYNLFEGSTWKVLSRTDETAGYYAVRPESICISGSPWEHTAGQMELKGTVQQIICQGNVIRYSVSVNGVTLDVDQLYEGQYQLERGRNVFLRIAPEDVICFHH